MALLRPPVRNNAAILKDKYFQLVTLTHRHPQILQSDFFDVKKLQCGQLLTTEAKKVYHSIIDRPAFVVQPQESQLGKLAQTYE